VELVSLLMSAYSLITSLWLRRMADVRNLVEINSLMEYAKLARNAPYPQEPLIS